MTSEREREREWNIHRGGEKKKQRFLSAVYVNIPRNIHQTAGLPFLVQVYQAIDSKVAAATLPASALPLSYPSVETMVVQPSLVADAPPGVDR